MRETTTMQAIDAMLLELDCLVHEPNHVRKPALKTLSDRLAHAWEAHRGDVLLRLPHYDQKLDTAATKRHCRTADLS